MRFIVLSQKAGAVKIGKNNFCFVNSNKKLSFDLKTLDAKINFID